MVKKIGIILLLIIVLTIMFVGPARNWVNSLFLKDKSELEEEEILGTLSHHNPRVEEVQRILLDAGFLPGPIDGRMGRQTREAIRELQKAKGLKPTSRVDAKTWAEINGQQIQKNPSLKITPGSDSSLKLTTPASTKKEKLKPETEKIKGKVGIKDEALSYHLESKDRTKQIQIALRNAGFYKDEIDGKIGIQTKRAIRAFQKSKGLEPDGVVGPKTWQELSEYLKD